MMSRRLRNLFRRSRDLPLYDKPARERHPISFTCSILAVVSVVTALGLPQWATSDSTGDCQCSYALTTVYCVDPHTVASTVNPTCTTFKCK